jgi:nucleotide-binding universal stress UspA family protein
MDTVIVGIDEIENSGPALGFAMREAARRGARLRVIRTWDITPPPNEILARGLDASALEGLEQHAERTVALALECVTRLEPGLSVSGKTVFGEPAEVLVDEAKIAMTANAEVLLVVDHRMRGSSVGPPAAHRLVRRAPCPLTIVRSPPTRGRARVGRGLHLSGVRG